MKTDRIPDIYIEQYILDELPENLRVEMDDLILNNPELKERINKIKKSDNDILAAYPAGKIAQIILDKRNSINNSENLFSPGNDRRPVKSGFLTDILLPVKKFINQINSTRIGRYALSLSSAAVLVFLIFFLFPGIKTGFDAKTDTNDTIRIKGLDSKLLLYRMKGRNVEEIKNADTAHKGDIVQVGYIATGNFRYGIILSIDGRGTVTLHFPDSTSSGRELPLNKKVLLNRSYELDDSPHFERFIMVLSDKPINSAEIIEKTKKLAISRDSAINGSVKTGENDAEFSIVIKKTE